MNRVLGVALVVGLAAACTSTPHRAAQQHSPGPSTSVPAAATALEMCRGAFGSRVASATATNVGDVRAWFIGPGPLPGSDPPHAHAFGTARGSDPAAWCWVHTGHRAFFSYSVGPNGETIGYGSTSGPDNEPPSGAPVFP
jgi:hypothetical protein